tara:strand:+ start:1480 stop:1734 length:255 start_codon:yes stop_codon:yes gene_type:complete
MVILVKYEELKELLDTSVEAWMEVGGGPNMDAFEFDPNLVDLALLDNKGYYDNRDAWIAGVQIKKLVKYINENLEDPIRASQTK